MWSLGVGSRMCCGANVCTCSVSNQWIALCVSLYKMKGMCKKSCCLPWVPVALTHERENLHAHFKPVHKLCIGLRKVLWVRDPSWVFICGSLVLL